MADYNLAQTGNLSPEDFAQQQQLNRQQQMAQMLMQQSAQPQGQMISGRYVAPSWAQSLVPLANIAASKYIGEKADTKAGQLAQQIRQNKSAANQEVLDKYLGTTAVPAVQGGIVGPDGQMTKQTTADMYNADMSLNPQYKQVAPVAGKAATAPDLAGALRAIDSPTNYYGAGKDLKAAIIKEMRPEKPSSVLEYEYALQNPAYANFDLGRRQAGATKLGLEIQNQLPFKQQIQKGAADTLIKNFETLQNIPTTLENMDKMIALSKQPMFAGVGGEAKLNAAKLLNNNFGTNISPEAVKNTEEFKSAAYMGILENLKKTDANPTMQQQNALKEALGNIGTDPSAIPKVVGVYRDILVGKAQQHNRQVKQTEAKGVEYPFDISIQLPQTAPAGGGIGNIDTSSLDAILRSRNAIK